EYIGKHEVVVANSPRLGERGHPTGVHPTAAAHIRPDRRHFISVHSCDIGEHNDLVPVEICKLLAGDDAEGQMCLLQQAAHTTHGLCMRRLPPCSLIEGYTALGDVRPRGIAEVDGDVLDRRPAQIGLVWRGLCEDLSDAGVGLRLDRTVWVNGIDEKKSGRE